ncbi:type III pantothenate kinase [Belliella kenyensis]|uniref:Type III pantothenate kinase n=1 Tax=Belliella kenyensis TaxID=1472724 RepID=A0ABV8ERD2_9BACT|nr:type III pantothenate kinase [Belliella kenyensis]MCH7402603.1 type III pantothenate kinase [Belliella kenyensis]MDN3603401.1 type III pantothenate kinase [Belliella kenyensis]
MFISIDAGNTNITIGFYDSNIGEWIHEFRIESKGSLTLLSLERAMHLFFLENNLKIDAVSSVGVSSVVPELNELLNQFCKEFLGKPCYFINGDSYRKLSVSTSRPNEIGTDLMCNVTAAYERNRQANIIVDFGTALTFTVVDDEGKVVGVNIVPGLKTAVKSLFSNTSKLPEVPLKFPKSAIGTNTVESIQAGILYGYTGLVQGMLGTIKQQLKTPVKVIATGGLSTILSNLKGSFDDVDRNLTLEGIRLITLTNINSQL